MFRLGVVCTLLALWLGVSSAFAAEYKLSNGDVYTGQAASFNDDGLIVRLDLGGFSPRVPWGKLSQETLKQLVEVPEAKEFAEPYIEIPIEVKERQREAEEGNSDHGTDRKCRTPLSESAFLHRWRIHSALGCLGSFTSRICGRRCRSRDGKRGRLRWWWVSRRLRRFLGRFSFL